jgi:signal transduction histidine kinase
MQERCEELGGTFEARSSKDGGTEIVASLPIMNGTTND